MQYYYVWHSRLLTCRLFVFFAIITVTYISSINFMWFFLSNPPFIHVLQYLTASFYCTLFIENHFTCLSFIFFQFNVNLMVPIEIHSLFCTFNFDPVYLPFYSPFHCFTYKSTQPPSSWSVCLTAVPVLLRAWCAQHCKLFKMSVNHVCQLM